jgi:hypothetical protein
MDSILPSLFGITVLLTSSLLLGRSGFTSFRVMTESWQQAETNTMQRLHSDISITSATRTGAELDLVVQNDGATPVIDFSKMDVLVRYSEGGVTYDKYIAFTNDLPQADDTWRVVAIVNDVIDPRVVNTGESISIKVQLNPAPDTSGNWVQVTSEHGVSASAAFD